MSIEAIAKASKVRDLESTTKFVLVALANYANDDNVAYPKQQTIADFCNLRRQTVNKHLQILIDKGYILKQQRRFTSGANQGRQAPNNYLLVFKSADKKQSKNSCVTLTDTTPNSCVTLNDSLSSVTLTDTISFKGYIDKEQTLVTDGGAKSKDTPPRKNIPLPQAAQDFLNKERVEEENPYADFIEKLRKETSNKFLGKTA